MGEKEFLLWQQRGKLTDLSAVQNPEVGAGTDETRRKSSRGDGIDDPARG